MKEFNLMSEKKTQFNFLRQNLHIMKKIFLLEILKIYVLHIYTQFAQE